VGAARGVCSAPAVCFGLRDAPLVTWVCGCASDAAAAQRPKQGRSGIMFVPSPTPLGSLLTSFDCTAPGARPKYGRVDPVVYLLMAVQR
jgi:hypothetical protein